MTFSTPRRLTRALLAASTILMLVTSGCWRSHTPLPPASAPPAIVSEDFVGNAACAECHQNQTSSHKTSRHARTLHAMSRSELGNFSPALGDIGHTGFVLQEKEGKYAVARPSQSDYAAPLDYALGSGKTGITYVSFLTGAKLAEFRMSWFPKQHKWFITPGAEALNEDDIGKIRPSQAARSCILCHAVTLPEDSLVPQERFFGVGCEACHGPGSVHVTAMRAGKYSEGQFAKIQTWPASRVNNLCGKCHGTEQDMQSQHLPTSLSNRMQSYGLTLSECYKQSKDTLSCISCHNPHTDVNTSAKKYEAICLNCHSTTAPAYLLPQQPRTKGKVCPVNSKDKCIGCHMPSRPAMPGSAVPIMMADHFIRKYK